MIRFHCPGCNGAYFLPDSRVGTEFVCFDDGSGPYLIDNHVDVPESEWFACDEPYHLLYFEVETEASERKHRLFQSACARGVVLPSEKELSRLNRILQGLGFPSASQLTRETLQATIDLAERYADNLVNERELEPARRSIGDHEWARGLLRESCRSSYQISGAVSWAENVGLHCTLIHDIFGNPFRPVTIGPTWLAWNDRTIPKLAQAIYDERQLPSGHFDAGRLAILADALEEAGCANADILSHCRSPGPHVRGCWVVDLLLGKK